MPQLAIRDSVALDQRPLVSLPFVPVENEEADTGREAIGQARVNRRHLGDVPGGEFVETEHEVPQS